MKLDEYLKLIIDKDAEILLEIDDGDASNPNFLYSTFWLSDYKNGSSTCKFYSDWTVLGISFQSTKRGYFLQGVVRIKK